MASFSLEYDLSFIKQTVKKFTDAATSKKLLNRIGVFMRNKSKQNFDKQSDPFGTPWSQSLAAVRENRKTLIDTGRLQSSIRYKISGKTLSVGTNVKYASFHQEGTAKIDARPFLGTSSDDLRVISDIISAFLKEVETS